jgi:23S rRNA A2030 N6-methylase RlmJ
VHDLKVPPTSFKATDIICVANPIRSADGLHKKRRLIQVTEVRKDWKDDPMLEHGFMDLLAYNPKTDLLEPTRELMEGESEVISGIAGRVKEWIGDFDAVWDNIKLRAKVKQTIVNMAEKARKPEILEADFVVRANDMFHIISDKIRKEHGELVSDEIYRRWESWMRKELKG